MLIFISFIYIYFFFNLILSNEKEEKRAEGMMTDKLRLGLEISKLQNLKTFHTRTLHSFDFYAEVKIKK